MFQSGWTDCLASEVKQGLVDKQASKLDWQSYTYMVPTNQARTYQVSKLKLLQAKGEDS